MKNFLLSVTALTAEPYLAAWVLHEIIDPQAWYALPTLIISTFAAAGLLYVTISTAVDWAESVK